MVVHTHKYYLHHIITITCNRFFAIPAFLELVREGKFCVFWVEWEIPLLLTSYAFPFCDKFIFLFLWTTYFSPAMLSWSCKNPDFTRKYLLRFLDILFFIIVLRLGLLTYIEVTKIAYLCKLHFFVHRHHQDQLYVVCSSSFSQTSPSWQLNATTRFPFCHSSVSL